MCMAARSNFTFGLTRGAAVLAVALLPAGCTSGGSGGTGQPTATTAAPARPLRVELTTTARVPEGGDARQAARRASPELQRFLDRYLTAAFVAAAGGKAGWGGLLKLFDAPVKASARKQLDALSLGAAAPQVSAVRPARATARAVVLYDERRPAAATVRLPFGRPRRHRQGQRPGPPPIDPAAAVHPHGLADRRLRQPHGPAPVSP